MILGLSNTIDLNKFTAYQAKLIAKAAKVELKELRPPRTLNQNNYLHVVLSIWALEYGYTLEEAKHLLKAMFGLKYTHESGHEFAKSTAQYTTAELSTFIDKIRNTAAKDGCYIPDAEEYLINHYKIHNELNNKTQYL